jgi:hypothetical protein
MLYRCDQREDYAHVRVCVRWRDFENFLADMGERPDGTSIDRIDNDGGYCPENCRWATSKEQQRNKRNNRLLTFNGVSRCLAEWSEILGIGYQVLYGRLRRGQSVEQAFTQKG